MRHWQLQRSRSWWSESGTGVAASRPPEEVLQRSRSWWSESGAFTEMTAHYRLHGASTKSLLVERVRHFIQMPLILK